MVARTLEQLTEAALALPADARAFLADLLVESLDTAQDQEIQAQWVAQAVRRLEEVRSGRVQPVPGPEAWERLRRNTNR